MSVPDGNVAPPNPFDLVFAFSVCGRLPRYVRVTPINSKGEQQPDGSCSQTWTEGASTDYPIPLPPLDGSLTRAELDCLACPSKGQPSHGRVVWYKAARSLYTLSLNDTNTSEFGETVNGRFVVPSAGQLIIEVKDVGDAVDVWGGSTATDAGWQTGSVRNGRPIGAERTLFWTAESAAGARYDFNVRGYRGTAPGFDVLFHWYRWDDRLNGKGSCCIQHEVEGLGLQVLPLPCEFDSQEPVTPQLRRAASGADGHFELRIPCCPTCGEGSACEPGNLSPWFVAWPTGSDGIIPAGHAKGWRVDGHYNTLWSPGANRLGYEFVAP